jgi:hypothetical protein
MTRPVAADDSKRSCVAASTDAQTLRKDDKLLEARDRLRQCAVDGCPAIVRSHCTRWLAEIESQIPTVSVRAVDAAGADALDASATLDGQAVPLGKPLPVDPGQHAVAVTRPDGTRGDQSVLAVDGDRSRVVVVKLAPAAASERAPGPGETPSHAAIPLGAWIVGGLGLASLGTSAAFAVVTGNDLSALQHSCSPACTDAQTQNGRTHALLTDVTLGVGLAAVGAAVTWAVLALTSGPGAAQGPESALRLDLAPAAGGARAWATLRF